MKELLQIYSIFSKRNVNSDLAKYEKSLKRQQVQDDPSLTEVLEKAIQNAKDDSGLPTEEDLNEQHMGNDDWAITFGNMMHLMRNKLTGRFQELDQSLRYSVEEMKCDVVRILREAGLANLAPDVSDSTFLKVVLSELDENGFPDLFQGFKNLSEFQLLYRGLIQHRIRGCLKNLYQDTTDYKLPKDEDIGDIDPEQLIGRLIKAYDQTLYQLEVELRKMLQEPSMARYAIIEEFRDRIWLAGNAENEWLVFINERKERLWPEQFAWQKYIYDTNKYIKELKLN